MMMRMVRKWEIIIGMCFPFGVAGSRSNNAKMATRERKKDRRRIILEMFSGHE